jgi:battenin
MGEEDISPSLWARLCDRLKGVYSGADPRVCVAFWLFGAYGLGDPEDKASNRPTGLINNVLYVILLSAALDLVGPDVPKGIVLLADIIPAFGTKLIAPYFIHVVPYSMRVVIFVFLSIAGMFVVGMSPPYTDGGTITSKLAGIVLASFSAGGGELSFVGLTHFYGPFSLAAWGSGTGAAGLVGAGAYSLATSAMGISVKATLLASALLPFVMAASFFLVLPRDALRSTSASEVYHALEIGEHPNDEEADEDNHDPRRGEEEERLLGVSAPDTPKAVYVNEGSARWEHFLANLRRLRKLFFP